MKPILPNNIWSCLLCMMLSMLSLTTAKADVLDSLQTLLQTKMQVQEKVYVQTDNNCYFVGDEFHGIKLSCFVQIITNLPT